MICPYCAIEIPGTQAICPSCFHSPGKLPAMQPVEHCKRHNVIVFKSSNLADLYHSRIEKYLQPDRVAWNWLAISKEQFLNATSSSAGKWGLLIIDALIAEKEAELLLRFLDENPDLIIGIEYEVSSLVPSVPPLPNAVVFKSPGEIDDWLLIMHSLLDLVEQQ